MKKIWIINFIFLILASLWRKIILTFLKRIKRIFNLQFTICNLQFILILILPFLIAGCGALIKQPAAIIKYYQIDYPAPAPVSAKEKIDKTIMIRPFNISSVYNKDSIVYIEDSFNCGFYQYNQWIAPPANLISEKIVRDLQASDAFEAVLTYGSFQPPDYRISASVEEIGEVKKGDTAESSVVIHFSVIKTSVTNLASEFIIGKTYHSSFPCEKDNPKSVVAAISKAVQIISIDFRKDLQKAL